jgi:bifunctional ADP-heptose synthase (sugar kinase/adenylyltransferase)
VKGKDYKKASDDVTGNITREKEEVEKYGGKVIFTEDITFSSSNLINRNFGIFSPETKSFLTQIQQKHKDTEVIQLLKNLSRLKVAVVGDAIIDEYYYTTLLGPSGKGIHPSVKYESKELFAGGALAVANHLAGFVNSVTLVTGLGTGDNYENFILSKLNNNITPHFYYFDKAPTVVKRRYVDGDLTKLFEVYIYDDQPSLKENDHKICAWLQNNAHSFDIVFVPDFGNGFISKNMVQSLCDKSRFLAVNTQVNSGNRGYHVINRYPRADFVSLNGVELRLATHNRHDALENLAEQTADNLGAKYFAVTLGSKGAILLDREAKKTHNIPVLSTKVLDRVGAGDTLLALTGLCLGGGLTSDTALFVGSAAAALEVQIVCNRESIKPENLFKYISTLLK